MRRIVGSAGLAALAALIVGVPSRGFATPEASPRQDPGTVMRQIAADPFRYGGTVSGTPIGDRRDLHLAIGLGVAAMDGTRHGQVILFDRDRRLVAIGTVSTAFRADAGWIGTKDQPCRLDIVLPSGPIALVGQCSAKTISGEIIARTNRPGLLTRLATWWGDPQTTGRAWLTASSVDPQS